MSKPSPAKTVHPEILLGLAEDLRQTLTWLGQQETEPPWRSVQARLRTLREAATVAGLASAEAAIAGLEARYQAEAPAEVGAEPSRLEEVLGRLLELIAQLAAPAEAEELGWYVQLHQVEATLERMADENAGAAAGLRRAGPAAEVMGLPPEQAATFDRLLREQLGRLRVWNRELGEAADRLRQAGRALARELNAAHRVPLEPLFARLRERVRRHGRGQGRPASLAVGGQRLDVAAGQVEPLSRALDLLLDRCLLSALEEPGARRRAGKLTGAALRLEGRRLASILEVELADDGPPDRPLPPPEHALVRALQQLRGRLWRIPAAEAGLRLVVQVPMWYSSFEAIPVEASVGEVLVPTAVVEQVLSGPGAAPPTPVVSLERRRREVPGPDPGPGLLCRVGAWRARLPGRVLGAPRRVVPRPARSEDPAWVLGWVRAGASAEGGGLPLVHPLAFVTGQAGWVSLFPELEVGGAQ
ncbi:MAG TPA: hypothetical protein P5076_13710 [Myxococcota bacterium]|nr:hypothetical protein [Myxococcota bacterium]